MIENIPTPLNWWRKLSAEEQRRIHQNSKHAHIPFHAFTMSTSMIRQAWELFRHD